MAKVLQFNAEGDTILLFDGKEITAKSLTPLPVGKMIWLEVKKGGDTPLLELAERKGAVGGLLQFLLQKGSDLEKAMASLRALTDGGGNNSPEMKWIKQVDVFWDSLGLHALDGEINAADLIKMLARFVNKESFSNGVVPKQNGAEKTLKNTTPFEAARIGQILDQFAKTIHIVNSSPQPVDETPFYIFPCFLAGSSGWGEWIFSFSRGKIEEGKKRGACRLDFFLQLSKLGNLSLQVTVNGNNLTGEFFLELDPARTHLENMTQDLVEALRQLGYASSFTCSLFREGYLSSIKSSLEKKLHRPFFSIIDIRA